MKQQESRAGAVRSRGRGLVVAGSVASAVVATLIATPSTAAPARSTASDSTASSVSRSTLSLMRKGLSSSSTFGALAGGAARMSATVTASPMVAVPAEGSFVSYQAGSTASSAEHRST